ncbi:hypothetical protein EJB05_19586 [Eragrostis curvula]|uniref:RBR-type E3 ubiquitin transferase n=1 Tax=Eragrostis curvula TaxID=38414 RepID=A0A5J9UXT1_9POAL|nr:hypothetical protein EJB05_19586 [Eragrostis curvula]
MSSGCSSSSSPSAAEVGEGYWEARDEAVARLGAMAARGGEVELSAEQLETNNQLQEDEVLALQAIYGDDRIKPVFVRYPLPNGTQVFLNLHPEGATVETEYDKGRDDGQLIYACSLKHLPPVVVTCLLPRSYPSTCAPYFTISAKWLDEPKVSYLCTIFDEISTELPGQEVLYRWVDWLNSSSWVCISLKDNIVFAPDKVSDAADERAIARRFLVDSTIPLMQSYNEKRHHEIFLQSLHECRVCLSENTGRNFIKLPCHHLFCLKCMESHCRIHVKEGNLTKLTCPDTTCRSLLPPSTLKSILGDEGYAQWESFALHKLLDTMPDLVYCPRCHAACLEVDNDAQCPECFFTFCSLCKERRHVGTACVTPAEKIRILRERHQKYSLPEKQLLREQREIDELLNVCAALRDSKQCPSCKMAISKTQGCNKMTCGNCGKFFCYRCNQAIREEIVYCLKSPTQGECMDCSKNGMYDEDSDDDPEELEPELVWLYPCPICGRNNGKWGTNNHILCMGCRGHYCALCGKRVLKSSTHYGPRGCQQHTDDPDPN